MDWLFAHADEADDAMDVEPSASESADGASGDAGAEDNGEITEDQRTAQSLRCDDCGRLLRDATAAEMHAVKTQHQNFSESTEAIKPLTEEEKQAKLAELRARMAQRKEEKRLAEIAEQKEKEKIRRKAGKEIVELKEKQKELEMQKALEMKRREKEEDRLAKAKIKAQIEADKKARAEKFEKEKLERQGLAATPSPPPVRAAQAPAAPAAAKDYTEARIQFRTATGTLTHTFKADDTLEAVYTYVASQTGHSNFKILQTFPRKVLEERGKSLRDLGLVPSAALVVQ
ncbi:hypothetical protein HDV05_004366 [Chytridiales sp. JEL 0842]|nr:hypothetical protein HDV05_004366 [Chytridiales sp. JEL 0842]